MRGERIRMQRTPPGIDEILGSYGLTVSPFGRLVQMKGVRFAILTDFIALGDTGGGFVIWTETVEALVDVHDDRC